MKDWEVRNISYHFKNIMNISLILRKFAEKQGMGSELEENLQSMEGSQDVGNGWTQVEKLRSR